MIVCEPMVKEEVLKEAWPFISALLPSVAAPSLKVTMPVGVPMPGLTTETVAVNVTVKPTVDGLPLVMSIVVVLAAT